MRKTLLWAALAFAASTALSIAQEVGVTDTTIRIGSFGPMTGSSSLYAKGVIGVETVYRDLNDRGGVHGRTIEIVREDDACDPARGIAAVKKLISQDRVFALNGGQCSGVVLAVKPEIEASGVPLIVAGAASSTISTPVMANLFHPLATTDVVARTLVDFAMTKPDMERIAFVSHSDEWGKSNRLPALEHLKAEYGLDPVLDLSFERGSTDATPQILQLRNADVQAVIVLMVPTETAVFLRDAYKYGLSVPMLAPQSISLEDTRERVGNPEAVKDLHVFYPYKYPLDSPEMKRWADLITKYHPGERVENFSYLGIGGALAVIEALNRVGPDLTREKFIAELDDLRDFESDIMATPITFSPDNHVGISGGAVAKFEGDEVVILNSWPAE